MINTGHFATLSTKVEKPVFYQMLSVGC